MPLSDAGFSTRVADQYRKLLREAHRALDDGNVPRDDRRSWIVPGRIEVLGKHVDYRSLLCTVERGIAIVARPHADRAFVIRDAHRREAVSLPLDSMPQGSLPWAVYPRTVVRRLKHNFGAHVGGCAVALSSNLPSASGVSSSSALTVGLTLVLASLSALDADPVWQANITDRLSLAGYIGALENGADFGALAGEKGVGTMGGAQDQTAILCCTPSQLDVFGWAPVRHERSVPWPDDYVFIVAVSGVVAAKSGAARDRYNRVARTAHRIVDAWNRQSTVSARTLHDTFVQAGGASADAGLPAALVQAVREHADVEFPASILEARLRQFQDEAYRIVPEAAAALATMDLTRFGELVAQSQLGAEDALGNQVAATSSLVATAHTLGAVAASAFGAGFGGSVWAMVPRSDADAFSARWRERYMRSYTGSTARTHFFVTGPSAPAFEVTELER
jgi:galactokinase